MTPALATWLRRIGAEHPRGVKRGPERARTVAERLGVVPPAPTTIIVAGTNGKGSTTAFAEQTLLAAGCSVGTTTSPHLHRFNERIRINGRAADDASIVEWFGEIERCRGAMELTYFEYAVLAALLALSRARVDYAVLEVGLGGRLDAVNIVDADVAVITGIGLDHQEFLGLTRERIGREKAGILRPGVPLVYGEPNPPASILAHAQALDVPVNLDGRDFGHDERSLWIRDAHGKHRAFDLPVSAVDPLNAATALEAVALADCPPDQRTVREAARKVRNPGRFEVVRRDGRTWILDVAHNPHGAAFLAKRLAARFPNRSVRAILGCLEDKDIAGIKAPLEPLVTEFAFADTGPERGRTGASLRAAAALPGAFAGTLEGAMAHLSNRSEPPDSVVLVLGSFDVVARARVRLKLLDCVS